MSGESIDIEKVNNDFSQRFSSAQTDEEVKKAGEESETISNHLIAADRNGDGKIDKTELNAYPALQNGVDEAAKNSLTKEEAIKFNENLFDPNHDGKITGEELGVTTSDTYAASAQKLKEDGTAILTQDFISLREMTLHPKTTEAAKEAASIAFSSGLNNLVENHSVASPVVQNPQSQESGKVQRQ